MSLSKSCSHSSENLLEPEHEITITLLHHQPVTTSTAPASQVLFFFNFRNYYMLNSIGNKRQVYQIVNYLFNLHN